MRKQPRALLTALALLPTLLMADAALAPESASAHARRATRARRAPAPVTPENLELLRECESGDTYDRRSGNGYFGAYQFSLRTWRSLGYEGLPSDALREVQDEAAIRLQERSGWGQWPACTRKLGFR